MTATLDSAIDYFGAALLILALAAQVARLGLARVDLRIAAGLGATAAAALISISHRSLLDWCVSAIDRLSVPGFLMVGLLAINAVTGQPFKDDREYRFGAILLTIAGIVLYPSAVGLIDYDVYVWGYSGFLLPAMLAAALLYSIWRRYWYIVAAIDLGIIGFLLDAGLSRNLWDYVIDPIAFVVGLVSCLIFAGFYFAGRSAQPSGDTPISH